jgi:hypothetical protein
VRFDEAQTVLTFETERALVARAAEVVDPAAVAPIQTARIAGALGGGA